MPSLRTCIAAFQVVFLAALAIFSNVPQSPADKRHGSTPSANYFDTFAQSSLHCDFVQTIKITSDFSSTTDILSWDFHSAEMYSSFGINVTAVIQASRSRRLGLPCLGKSPCFDVPLRLQGLLDPPNLVEACPSSGNTNRVIGILATLRAPPGLILFTLKYWREVRLNYRPLISPVSKNVSFRSLRALSAFALSSQVYSCFIA